MKTKHVNKQRQQGAALVVGLVLLLVMTILGVSTMGTASLELNMAGNSQFYQNAFQLAETGNDVMLARLNAGTAPLPAVTAPDAENCLAPGAAINVPEMGGSFQNTFCAMGIRTAVGGSLGKISTIHFENRSQGMAQGRANSFHRQGFRIEAPGLGGT